MKIKSIDIFLIHCLSIGITIGIIIEIFLIAIYYFWMSRFFSISTIIIGINLNICVAYTAVGLSAVLLHDRFDGLNKSGSSG
jgi:hypothetical protein